MRDAEVFDLCVFLIVSLNAKQRWAAKQWREYSAASTSLEISCVPRYNEAQSFLLILILWLIQTSEL